MKLIPIFALVFAATISIRADESLLEQAIKVVRANDSDGLRGLIDQGLNVNEQIKKGDDIDSLLHLAVKGNKDAIVEVLLSSGANLEITDTMRYTPIYYANRSPHILTMLIHKGAKLESSYPDAPGPIFSYLHTGFIEGLRILLENKANPNSIHKHGARWQYDSTAPTEHATPLMTAAMHCQTDVARLLLEFGANKKYRNDRRHTAWDFAKNPYGCQWSAQDIKMLR